MGKTRILQNPILPVDEPNTREQSLSGSDRKRTIKGSQKKKNANNHVVEKAAALSPNEQTQR
jgi:hypothetical protein